MPDDRSRPPPSAEGVLEALHRVRRRGDADGSLDELCAAVVSWGRWRRAAFVSVSAGGFSVGAAGISPEERAFLRRVSEAIGPEARRPMRERVLAEFRVAPGLDVAFVPVERRRGLPDAVLPGPSCDGAPGERWEAGDECVVLPSRADGASLGVLALAEPADGRRPATPEDLAHLRLLAGFAAAAAETVHARRRAEDAGRDEARGILGLVEELNSIESMQPLLDRLAAATASLAGYRVAVLSVYLPEGALLGGQGLTDAERARFVQSMSATPLERRLAKRERIRSFAFPGTSVSYVPHSASLGRSPAFTTSAAPQTGSWHPEDRLFILVRTGTGKEIGVLSLDEPLDGNAPTEDTLGRLRLVERFLGLGASLLYSRVLARDLHRSDEAYRALVDGAPVGIWRGSDGPRVLSANPRLAEIFGYGSPEDLMADPGFVLRMDPGDLAAAARQMDATGVARGVEVRATRVDGTPIRLRVTTRRHPERHETLGIAEDVTEARHLAEHLERTQRIEALGTLASGIAHDFNNLLAGILGYAALLAQRLEDAPALGAMAHAIEESARRAADLTRQLLGVARPARGEAILVDAGRVIADAARMARETFDRRIVVDVDVPDDLPAAIVDPAELHRAILNLCINARDAMPRGGVLSLTAAADPRGPRAPAAPPRGAGWVRIEVSDTGVGMDEGVRARLFQPFFTTKPRGKGTGLGLYTVYQIAVAYGGAVEVDSRLGEGTQLRIYLPAAPRGVAAEPCVDGGVARRAPPLRAVVTARPGSSRALLVEDEEPLRRLAAQVLREDGWEVVEAADGEEAVRRFVEDARGFDVVVLDLVLPLLSGDEVFRRMRAHRPDVPVILSSGNVFDALDDPDVRAGVAGVLPKPYVPTALLDAVRRVRTRSAAGSGGVPP